MKNYLIVFITLVFLASCNGQSNTEKPQVAKPVVNDLPQMEITLMDGSKSQARELVGKNIFVMFFPDCEHCQEEAQAMEANLPAFKDYSIYFLSERNHNAEPTIEAVNLSKGNSERFSFRFPEEESTTLSFGEPERFLYEPFSSVLKAGAFKSLANAFPVTKIHSSTHLYTSANLVTDFPGRIFEIESRVKPDKKAVSKYFPEGRANVLTRNYPLSPEELKKKTGLNDGGKKYLIGFSSQKEKVVVVANRIK